MKALTLRRRITVALLAAVLAVISPFSVQIGPIPLTFATFGVYLAAALLGGRDGTAAVALYLLLGAVGLPVFSGFSGGIQRFVSPTGGYLIGYLFCAFITGWLTDRFGKSRPAAGALAALAGTAALYLFGTLWYLVSAHVPLGAALISCVLPFLPGDAVKILAATATAYPLRALLNRLYGSAS